MGRRYSGAADRALARGASGREDLQAGGHHDGHHGVDPRRRRRAPSRELPPRWDRHPPDPSREGTDPRTPLVLALGAARSPTARRTGRPMEAAGRWGSTDAVRSRRRSRRTDRPRCSASGPRGQPQAPRRRLGGGCRPAWAQPIAGTWRQRRASLRGNTDTGASNGGNADLSVPSLETPAVRHPSPAARAIIRVPATSATPPIARATRSPAGARRSIVIATVTTAMARRSITPMTSRLAVSPALQQMQSRPRRRPYRHAAPASADNIRPGAGASRQHAR